MTTRYALVSRPSRIVTIIMNRDLFMVRIIFQITQRQATQRIKAQDNIVTNNTDRPVRQIVERHTIAVRWVILRMRQFRNRVISTRCIASPIVGMLGVLIRILPKYTNNRHIRAAINIVMDPNTSSLITNRLLSSLTNNIMTNIFRGNLPNTPKIRPRL